MIASGSIVSIEIFIKEREFITYSVSRKRVTGFTILRPLEISLLTSPLATKYHTCLELENFQRVL